MSATSYESVQPLLDWLALRGIAPGTEVTIRKGVHAGKVGTLLSAPSPGIVTVVVGELFTPGAETIRTTAENIRAVNRPDHWHKDDRAAFVRDRQREFVALELISLRQEIAGLTNERTAYNDAMRQYREEQKYALVAEMQRLALRCTVQLEILRELAAVCERYTEERL